MSYEKIWDPSHEYFQVSLVEYDRSYPVPLLSVPNIISRVETALPCTVETTLKRDDTYLSFLDRYNAHVSVRLGQDLHVESFIDFVKVRFEEILQISLAHTNNRHHEFANNMLATKWGISNSKVKATLDETT